MAKPKTKPFGFFQNFPNLNRTERFRFGLNPVCIGLKPNFPNTSAASRRAGSEECATARRERSEEQANGEADVTEPLKK